MSSMIRIKRDSVLGDLTPAGQRPGADTGDPQVSALTIESPAAAHIGVWECAPGGWPVIDRKDTETCYVLSGRAVITDNTTGDQYKVGAGDLVVLPVGWNGRWDILETLRKVYVIC